MVGTGNTNTTRGVIMSFTTLPNTAPKSGTMLTIDRRPFEEGRTHRDVFELDGPAVPTFVSALFQ
jgi:hypothetical protein